MTPLTVRQRWALAGVADEEVYRSESGVVKWWPFGSDSDVDAEVQALVAAGLVDEPPEGASFYTLTDDGADRLLRRE